MTNSGAKAFSFGIGLIGGFSTMCYLFPLNEPLSLKRPRASVNLYSISHSGQVKQVDSNLIQMRHSIANLTK